jgi:hypothetical protein
MTEIPADIKLQARLMERYVGSLTQYLNWRAVRENGWACCLEGHWSPDEASQCLYRRVRGIPVVVSVEPEKSISATIREMLGDERGGRREAVPLEAAQASPVLRGHRPADTTMQGEPLN